MNKKATGHFGESQAAQYLRANGYVIWEQSWRWKNAEVDIIAFKDEILCFIEVKTRSSDLFGHPAEMVSSGQMDRIADAANAYIIDRAHDGEIRFDIISLLKSEDASWQIEHFEDVFFPDNL